MKRNRSFVNCRRAVISCSIWFFILSIAFSQTAGSRQSIDEEYTRLIREATTKAEFLNPLTDYLPRVDGVPTPRDVLGYIAGAPGKLTPYADIVGYLRLLSEASPNVSLFPIGKTAEGRDMVVAAIADAETMKQLPAYKGYLAKLSDPRLVTTEAEADEIIARAKPIYWLTGNLHSGESGAAEVAMELAYRLAVDSNPIVKAIRDNMIVLITPSVEPDGHDKHTDWFYKYNRDVTDYESISRVPYWGKYTFHDNNRDMIMISQPETRNEADNFFEWHPIVVQDNHESIPFLYVSSGTGPYNTTYDASLTSEWNLLAWWEVTRLNSYGMPGVWTHGFWDGWAPNYLFAVANNHNALGRFYETFGNSIGNTMHRKVSGRYTRSTKTWFMPVPPYKEVEWSMRNNVNYQQSADLSAFYFVATHKAFFLKNFWKRGKTAYDKGLSQPPYACVIPSGQNDPVDTSYLVNTLLRQHIEVKQAASSFKVNDKEYPNDSYIIRMDQPYRNLIVNLLGIQEYPSDAPRSYDDTGWTLGLHMGVETDWIEDKKILDVRVNPVTNFVKPAGSFEEAPNKGAYVIDNGTINSLLTARLRWKDFRVLASETSFQVGDRSFAAGSLIVPAAGAKVKSSVRETADNLGLNVFAAPCIPDVKLHDLTPPRIAIFHTWSSTQDDGWVRFAFDQLGIPFTIINKDHLRRGKLKQSFDVILLSNARGNTAADIVNGIDPQRNGPLAFEANAEFKHLGTPDSSPDITGGMGLEGVQQLQRFALEGGLLIALHNSIRIPVEYGLVRGARIYNPSAEFYNPGSLFKGEIVDDKHPVTYGYDPNPVIYRSQSGPLLTVDSEHEKYVVLRFADEEDICLSGIIKNIGELKGRAAVMDIPAGKGHVMLFTFNPFWRDMNHGNYMFVFNAILHFDHLDTKSET